MAEENIYKQEFGIRNLLTRSVTLYPTRAQITRDIDEITLKVSYLSQIDTNPSLTVSPSLVRTKLPSMGLRLLPTKAQSRSMGEVPRLLLT